MKLSEEFLLNLGISIAVIFAFLCMGWLFYPDHIKDLDKTPRQYYSNDE